MPRIIFTGSKDMKFFGMFRKVVFNKTPGEIFGCSVDTAAQLMAKWPTAFKLAVNDGNMDKAEKLEFQDALKKYKKLKDEELENDVEKELKLKGGMTKELKPKGK